MERAYSSVIKYFITNNGNPNKNPKQENKMVYNSASWSRIINCFNKELKRKFQIKDISKDFDRFPSQEIAYNKLMELRLLKCERNLDQKCRDYAKYFFQRLLYKSREELSKNILFEESIRKDEEAIKAN